MILSAYLRFETPGHYRVRVQHDFGWKGTPQKPLPVAAAEIDVRESSEEWLKRWGPEPIEGSRRERAHLPLNLARLVDRIAAGKTSSLDALSPREKAFRMNWLAQLLGTGHDNAQLEVTSLAKQRLEQRQEAGQAVRTPEETTIAYIRRYAKDNLNSSDTNIGRNAAQLLVSVGEANDLDLVLAALEQDLDRLSGVPEPGTSTAYWIKINEAHRQRNNAGMLVATARVLIARGGRIPARYQNSPAVLAIDLAPRRIAVRQPWSGSVIEILTFNAPDAWLGPGQEEAEPALRALHHANPFIRELALGTIQRTASTPLSPAVREALPALLRDKTASVQMAACDLVQKSGDETYLPILTELMKTTLDSSVAYCAGNAAQQWGGEYLVLELWAERLDEPRLTFSALSYLLKTLSITGLQGNVPPQSELIPLRDKWQQFLKANKASLIEGRRFELNDPEVLPGLIPASIQPLKS
ncbi:HEAT repeat domain-containing protein [bacterium]|nr:MAG: HEAT repeat domain-containing protein [bacterium]